MKYSLRLLLLTITIAAGWVFLGIGISGTAHAAQWCEVLAPNAKNSGSCHGVTKNALTDIAGGGSTQAQETARKQAFIDRINKYYSYGGYQKVGAQYVMNGMKGSGTATWEQRVLDPSVKMTVEQYNNVTCENTAYNPDTGRVVKYTDEDEGCGVFESLVFRVNGVIKYVIKRDCGNPLGTFPGLPQPGGWTASGTSTSATTSVSTGTTVTFKHKITVTGSGSVTGAKFDIRGKWSMTDLTGTSTTGGTALTPAASCMTKFPDAGSSGTACNSQTVNVPNGSIPSNVGYYCQYVRYTSASGTTSLGASKAMCVKVTKGGGSPAPVGCSAGGSLPYSQGGSPLYSFTASAPVNISPVTLWATDYYWEEVGDPPVWQKHYYSYTYTETRYFTINLYGGFSGASSIGSRTYSYNSGSGYPGSASASASRAITEPASLRNNNDGGDYTYYATGPGGTGTKSCLHFQRHFSLTPTLTINPSNTSLVNPSQSDIRITASVNNTGPNNSYTDDSWYISKIIVAPNQTLNKSSSPDEPCDQFTNYIDCDTVSGSGWSADPHEFGVGNNPLVSNKSDPFDPSGLKPGTKICYVLSVGEQSWNKPEWAHSSPQCVTLEIIPATNVTGNDLRVGSTISTISGNLSSKVSGMVFPQYGSWAEYGILAPGVVNNFASQSGAVSGGAPNQSQWSALTFSNTLSSYGNLGSTNMGLQPNIANYMQTAKSNHNKPLAVNLGSASLNISSDSALASAIGVPAGNVNLADFNRSVAIITTGDITISRNISYTEKTLTSINDMPQLVLIAKNINIGDNVTNVDAWLIATGNVYTCSSVNSMAKLNTLTSSQCNRKLVINGPIQASGLLMARTYYNETDPTDPAEQINSSGATYLWSHRISENSGSWQTMYTTDLPPRF